MKNLKIWTTFCLLLIGLSIGILSTLCFQSFSFFIPSSISPSQPLPDVIPLSSNRTCKYANTSVHFLATPPPPQVAEITSYYNAGGLLGNMSDDHLFLRASMVEQSNFSDEGVKQKVAFMFLTPGPLPLAPFWDRFFKGYKGFYSVYVHPHPSYNDSSVPEDSAFYGRRIPSQPVHWGTISMVDAERRLLANALLDPFNQRFALLSDSCIPVFNFTMVYEYLIGANRSFMNLIDNPWKRSRWRYDRRMLPIVNINQWRKGSQWFEIRRDVAVKIVSDDKVYRVFHDFCPPPCFSDEHYMQTLVNIQCPELNSDRSLTWLDWSLGGGHPRRFGLLDVTVELLEHIRFGSECEYNRKPSNVCHLFARKFAPSAVGPLLKIGPSLLGFDP